MNHVIYPLSSADISIFCWKSANFAISKDVDIDCFNSFSFFFESLKVVLIHMVIILMMSAKMATLGLLKIKIFLNKGYDVIIFVHDFTNKILSRDLSYIVDLVI